MFRLGKWCKSFGKAADRVGTQTDRDHYRTERCVHIVDDRVVGYQQALTEAGLGESELIYYGAFNEQSGYELTNQAMMQIAKAYGNIWWQ